MLEQFIQFKITRS